MPVLDDDVEAQCPHRRDYPADDLGIGVGNPPYALAIAALGIEDAGQEARPPVRRHRPWPLDEPLDLLDRAAYLRPNGHHPPPGGGLFGERELGGADASPCQVAPRPVQGLGIGQSKPEPADFPWSPPAGAQIRVGADTGIAADHPAEIAAAVVSGLLRWLGESARAHQLVAARQMRSAVSSLLRAGDMLPAA